MSRTRKIVAVAVVWLGVGLVVALALVGHPSSASAHEEGAVAVCNWENFEQYGHDGYNAHWIACNHTLHNHRSGYHPWAQMRREARTFRAYCGIG